MWGLAEKCSLRHVVKQHSCVFGGVVLGSGSSYHQHRLQELGGRTDLQIEIQEMLQGACCPGLRAPKGSRSWDNGSILQRRPPAGRRTAFPDICFLSAPIPAQRHSICIARMGLALRKCVTHTHKIQIFFLETPDNCIIEGSILQNDLLQGSSNSGVSLTGV